MRVGEVFVDRSGLEPCGEWLRGRPWRASSFLMWFSSARRYWTCSDGDVDGEKSAGGYSGSTLEVSGSGEPGRKTEVGGGVADRARGLAWFEVVGEAPGEETRGDEWPVADGREGRGWAMSGAEDDSTSRSRDCRKLGP